MLGKPLGVSKVTYTGDLNELIDNGYYRTMSSCVNVPIAYDAITEVLSIGNFVRQIWSRNNLIYYRSKTDSSWNNWLKL